MGGDREFFCQFTGAENFDAIARPVGEAGSTEGGFINARAFIEAVEIFEIDGQIPGAMTGVIEPALGDAADERHLAAFETNSDGAARASRLALATAAAGFAMAAGLALAETFAAVFGAGTGF